jgi:hypothetical protein
MLSPCRRIAIGLWHALQEALTFDGWPSFGHGHRVSRMEPFQHDILCEQGIFLRPASGKLKGSCDEVQVSPARMFLVQWQVLNKTTGKTWQLGAAEHSLDVGLILVSDLFACWSGAEKADT